MEEIQWYVKLCLLLSIVISIAIYPCIALVIQFSLIENLTNRTNYNKKTMWTSFT